MFTGVYSRELYNAIRQTMLDGTSAAAPAYTMVSKEDYSAVKKLIGRMEGVLRYEHHVPLDFVQPVIEATAFLKELFVPGSTK